MSETLSVAFPWPAEDWADEQVHTISSSNVTTTEVPTNDAASPEQDQLQLPGQRARELRVGYFDNGDTDFPMVQAYRQVSNRSIGSYSNSWFGSDISARHPSTEITEPPSSLDEQIPRLMEKSSWPHRSRDFLPEDKLDSIITSESVLRELGISDEGVLSKILPHRRKLFAILALMAKADVIYELIKEGIMDEQLPFINNDSIRSLQFHLRDQDGRLTDETRTISSCEQWKRTDRESFCLYQQQLMAPHFVLGCDVSPDFEHSTFKHDIILPFLQRRKDGDMEDDGVFGDTSDLTYDEALLGGTATVHHVKIHWAHRSCGHEKISSHLRDLQCDQTSLVVKKLNKHYYPANMAEIDKEVDNLKRFFGRDHGKRIIRLLFTFELDNVFHMIFPGADANLQQFWKFKFPTVDRPKRGHELAAWMAREMFGLAEGLHMIHNSTDTSPAGRSYGRHGDIKPENILWFADSPNPDHQGYFSGVLKISDFGLTDFRTEMSKSKVDARSIGGTETYEAPECQYHVTISQSYDMWSLGCVLLLFVTWYADGWEEVEQFSGRRTAASHLAVAGKWVRPDTFYTVTPGTMINHAIVNTAVTKQIDMLRQHQRCSNMFIDVLDLIAKRLLIVNPKARADSNEVRKTFEDIKNRCDGQSIDYTTKHYSTLIMPTAPFSPPKIIETEQPKFSPVANVPQPRSKISVSQRVKGFFQSFIQLFT